MLFGTVALTGGRAIAYRGRNSNESRRSLDRVSDAVEIGSLSAVEYKEYYETDNVPGG